MQRVLKHCQYLREFGWQPVVLTVSNGDFPARDESLLQQIPEDVHVERVHIPEPYDLYRKFTGAKKDAPVDVNVISKDGSSSDLKRSVAEWIRATFFIPDARMGWLWTGIPAAKRLVKEFNCQAVYSSSPPYTTSLIARAVKRQFGLPWVAGFRDPWTGFQSTPNRWWLPAAIDASLEASVYRTADVLECAWQGIARDIHAKVPDLDTKKLLHVPNGFDSADFPETKAETSSRRAKCTITYTGSMYGTRNPESFFIALTQLFESQLLRPEEITIRFVGRFGDEVQAMFASFDSAFPGVIDIVGYVPHGKSIELCLDSDALLLVVDEAKESQEIVPGKVYEYIGTHRPVIAIAPLQSAIADLLKQTNGGAVSHQSQPEVTAQHVLHVVDRWRAGQDTWEGDNNSVAKYERRESARTLASALDSLLQSQEHEEL